MTLWSVNALVISISFMAYMIDLEVEKSTRPKASLYNFIVLFLFLKSFQKIENNAKIQVIGKWSKNGNVKVWILYPLYPEFFLFLFSFFIRSLRGVWLTKLMARTNTIHRMSIPLDN